MMSQITALSGLKIFIIKSTNTRLYQLWQYTIIPERYNSVHTHALISQIVYVGISQMNKNRFVNLVNYYSRWAIEIANGYP